MKVFLASPIYKPLEPESAASFVALAVHLALRSELLVDASSPWAIVAHDSNQARARNLLFRRFMRSGADRMLAVDADQVFSPTDVSRLLAVEEDVVVPLITKRAGNEEGHVGAPLAGPEIDDRDGSLIEMECIGFGMVSISRACIERMAGARVDAGAVFAMPGGEVVPEIVSQQVVDGEWLAVDAVFSRRWRQLGGRMWLAPSISVGHIGTHVYR